MNHNYQAEKLLKRLQNNPIKNHVKFNNTNVAFSVWHLHLSVIIVADALAQAYILGSTDKYQDITLLFCRNILWAFTRPIVATKSRQYDNKINIIFPQGKVVI